MKQLSIWLAFGAGVLHWAVCSLVVGGEAWDGAVYFASLPALAVICLALGARDRERAWRWGAFAAVGQAVGLVATAGAGASLLPVGLALLAVLGAGLALCSWLGAKLAGRLGAERG